MKTVEPPMHQQLHPQSAFGADTRFTRTLQIGQQPPPSSQYNRGVYEHNLCKTSPDVCTASPQIPIGEVLVTPLSSLRTGRETSPHPEMASLSPINPMAEHPCSFNDCAHYNWQHHNYYESWKINQGYHGYVLHQHYSPHEIDAPYRNATRAPSFDAEFEGRYSRHYPIKTEAVDTSDREVEMITSREMMRRSRSSYGHTHPYSYDFANYHYQYYPYVRPPAHHNISNPCTSYGYNANCYPKDISASKRKRKSHDEFLLRPGKDYIIYGDRSASPYSDITASPTPSLDDFNFPEEEFAPRKRKPEDFFVNCAAPPLDCGVEEPRIERHHVKKRKLTFGFDDKEAGSIVRIVSPTKAKSDEENIENKTRDGLWRGRGENSVFIAISNSISRSSSAN